ncbi:hypothetical protein Taro_040058 [Colocasia esculenta]|uniref:Uncharacterized protein n=1 Tax=Colocasia esculenta TaxID=4460 RepID=A0A843WP41_COLES|nr:hypothetical protein [Colocasia esculenta]
MEQTSSPKPEVLRVLFQDEFPPYVGVDERCFEDIHESNSSNVQATSISKARKTRGPTQKTAFQPPQGMKWTCMFIRGQPVGEPSSKLAGTLGLYARNEAYFCPYKKWKQQSMQSFNDVMKEIMVHFDFVNQEGMPANMEDEKVIEACQEKDLMSSSEPTILSPILDAVCNGHHGGFERGCGLGWSRMSRWGDSGNQASNYNIKQLTVELQNAKAEIEAMHARDKEREEAMKAREKEREEAMKAREAEREEAMQAREREMQARMERMEAMLTMRFSES